MVDQLKRNKMQNNLFRELATLLKAGLSTLQASQHLFQHSENKPLWKKIEQQVQNGRTLSQCLKQYHLVNAYQYQIIQVAEQAGNLPQALDFLAKSFEARQVRLARLKSKLTYPTLVMAVSFLAPAAVASFTPSVSSISIILSLGLKFTLLFLLLKTIFNFMKKDNCYWLSSFDRFRNKYLYQLQFQVSVFTLIQWQSQAGLDFQSSFLNISQLINSKSIKQQLTKCASLCGQGKSVCSAIEISDLPISIEFKQTLNTAEATGTWSTTLQHQLEIYNRILEDKIQSQFNILVGVFYLFAFSNTMIFIF